MGTVNIGLHLPGAQERIVDERVDGVCMMDIDDTGTEIGCLVDKLIAVEIAVVPLLVGVDSAEWSDQYIEIIIEAVAFFTSRVPE